jgi:hypothetical protein
MIEKKSCFLRLKPVVSMCVCIWALGGYLNCRIRMMIIIFKSWCWIPLYVHPNISSMKRERTKIIFMVFEMGTFKCSWQKVFFSGEVKVFYFYLFLWFLERCSKNNWGLTWEYNFSIFAVCFKQIDKITGELLSAESSNGRKCKCFRNFESSESLWNLLKHWSKLFGAGEGEKKMMQKLDASRRKYLWRKFEKL